MTDLLSDFERVQTASWAKAAREALGDTFVELDADGLPIEALYTEYAGIVPPPGTGTRVRGRSALPGWADGWDVRHEYGDPDPSSLARALAVDVEHGVGSLWLRLDPSIRWGGSPGAGVATREVGAMLDCLPAFRDALARIDPTATPVYFDAGTAGPAVAAFAFALAEERDLPLSDWRGGVLCDPVGTLAALGGIAQPFELAYISMADVATALCQRAPKLSVFGVSGSVWHDGGATPAQEVAFAIATGIDYLRAMERYRLSPADVAARMVFQLSLGPRPLRDVAKLRAARMLWSGVLSRAGLDATSHGMRIHARSSRRRLAHSDPWNNLLRGTVATFAAACAGAEAIAIAPLDSAASTSGDFGRRMAINTQLIARDESHLHRVVDPLGGSWFIEQHTDALARRAWDLVQEIEEQGGIVAALRAGYVQRLVAVAAAEESARVAAGQDVVVGVTVHPPEKERTTDARPWDRKSSVRAAMKRHATVSAPPEDRQGPLVALRRLLKKGDPPDRIDGAVTAARAGAGVGEIMGALTDGGGRIVIDPVRPAPLGGGD